MMAELGVDAEEQLLSRQGADAEPNLTGDAVLYISYYRTPSYIVPFDRCRTWTGFHAFVKDLCEKQGDEECITRVENGRLIAGREGSFILPELYEALLRPGDRIDAFILQDDGLIYVPAFAHDHSRIADQYSRQRPDGVQVFDLRQTFDAADGDAERYARRSRGSPHMPYIEAIEPEGQSDSEGSVDSRNADSEDSDSSTDETQSEPSPPAEAVRVPVLPVDRDGNQLSIQIDIDCLLEGKNRSRAPEHGERVAKPGRAIVEMSAENLRITRAMSEVIEGRTAIHLYNLTVPDSAGSASAVSIRWYHLHAEQLDWSQFKAASTALPGLADGLRRLITKTLTMVEKDHLKAFLNGMFIEPGTVLRGDDESDARMPSVIFSCIPYFDIRKPTKPSSGQIERLHPARSLIESYYPYEPVRDRDEEQAFNKYRGERDGRLIHVPYMWMLNVGSDCVVTCGHQSLSSNFMNSLEVVPEDTLAISGPSTKKTPKMIRMKDWDGRTLLYTFDECQTYFEMEQKLIELRFITGSSPGRGVIQIARKTPSGYHQILPANWPALHGMQDEAFVDLQAVNDDIALASPECTTDSVSHATDAESLRRSQVPPFLEWPGRWEKSKYSAPMTALRQQHALRSLEYVEKSLINEILPEEEATGPVDQAFTSSAFYESLPEDTFRHAYTMLVSPLQGSGTNRNDLHHSYHERILDLERHQMISAAKNFMLVVNRILSLYIADTSSGTMLRKLWGGLARVTGIANHMAAMLAGDNDRAHLTQTGRISPESSSHQWWIRMPHRKYEIADMPLPLPSESKSFAKSVRHCSRCKSRKPFTNANEALAHLRTHSESLGDIYDTGAGQIAHIDGMTDADLMDWIESSEQNLVESSLWSVRKILDAATKESRSLLGKFEELMDGVTNAQGELSSRYAFPRSLLEALHGIIVLFLAVERSLDHTRECLKDPRSRKQRVDSLLAPETINSVEVLQRFASGAQASIMQARIELCEQVGSSTLADFWGRLSLEPQYISSWLIRRLMVKPLDDSMSVADMYREYLSTLQFQVNHRPGKRLLRSINLLQEELIILRQVNDWQMRLVENYMRVLDGSGYLTDFTSRDAMFQYERLVLVSCLDTLRLMREEFIEQAGRCGPLTNRTKQSLEINEEDHGKAILVFTVVTVIFLPLSFVTSYLGMNTTDIRDMNRTQGLFYEIAIPLTVAVMLVIVIAAYNGDALQDQCVELYRAISGKQDRTASARGISVIQRQRASKGDFGSSSTLDYKSIANEAEYATALPSGNDPYFSSMTQVASRRFTDTNPSPSHVKATTFNDIIGSPDIAPIGDVTYQAGMPPASPPYPPPSGMPHTTYTRVPRSSILPQVLAQYNVPWTIDPKHADSILIKQAVEQDFVDDLVERSKDMRQGRLDPRTGSVISQEFATYEPMIGISTRRDRPRISERTGMRVRYASHAGHGRDSGAVRGYTWVSRKEARRRRQRRESS